MPNNGNGNVSIDTATATAVLDVNGTASVSGTLAFRTGTGNLQTTAKMPYGLAEQPQEILFLLRLTALPALMLLQNTNANVDLGSLTNQWRNIYAGGLNITNHCNLRRILAEKLRCSLSYQYY